MFAWKCFVVLLLVWVALLAFLGVRSAISNARLEQLLVASRDGDLDTIQSLIRNGVDVTHRNVWDTTALMLAAAQGKLKCVKLLLASGADVNERSRENRTPLMHAAEGGHLEMVLFLRSMGAKMHLEDVHGNTAYDLAMQEGHPHVANAIAELQPKPTTD